MKKKSKNPIYFVNFADGKEVDLADKKYKKQILRFGKWLYEDAPEGEFEVTKEKAMQMVDNFKKKTIENVPVTRGHVTQDEMDKNPDLIAGYVEELEVEDDGVYAVIKTADDSADEEIASKYKNVSASIDSNYQDHETGGFMGWVMRHLALTTEPYIKALNPSFIALSDEYNKNIISINLEEVKEETKTEEVKEEVKEEVVEEVKIEAVVPPIEEKKEEEVVITPKDIEEIKEGVKEIVKEETKETPEEMEERIRKSLKEEILKELKESKEEEVKTETNTDGAEKEPKLEAKVASDTKLSELEQSLKLAKSKIKSLELKETESEVDDLIEKGVVLPAQKDTALLLLRNKAVVNLAEGKSDNVANLFKSYLTNTLPQVDLSEKGVPPKTKETKDKPAGFLGLDPKEVDRLARKYPERGMS